MKVFENEQYKEDIKYVSELNIPWSKLHNKTILISGATGSIGSFLIDVLMYKNFHDGLNCMVYALGRNKHRANDRFSYCVGRKGFQFISHDINIPFIEDDLGAVDYVVHLASNTHPLAYATDPIGTITANIVGTINMLEFAVTHNASRCVFASSNEIYGENRGDVEKFDEYYCGYIDSNTIRAGYPESKRAGEALCQAYISQKKLDIVIPRLTRTYGPTLLKSDTKALSQFLRKGVAGEDIVLKSAGTQYFSYLYIADTVSGLLTVLLCGDNGEAYNIADEQSDIMLIDLANVIANIVGKKVIFELPNEIESVGFSKANKARLDSTKLKKLGWSAKYNIKEGIKKTIDIINEIQSL